MQERLRHALERVRGLPVKVVSREEWAAALRAKGEPTQLTAPLSPFAPGMQNVSVVTVAASTWPAVSSPGYHHVRLDHKDAPSIFNTDSYDAVEDLCREPDFALVCRTAGVAQDKVDCAALRAIVFLVGPRRRPDHHSEQVPPDIARAKKK